MMESPSRAIGRRQAWASPSKTYESDTDTENEKDWGFQGITFSPSPARPKRKPLGPRDGNIGRSFLSSELKSSPIFRKPQKTPSNRSSPYVEVEGVTRSASVTDSASNSPAVGVQFTSIRGTSTTDSSAIKPSRKAPPPPTSKDSLGSRPINTELAADEKNWTPTSASERVGRTTERSDFRSPTTRAAELLRSESGGATAISRLIRGGSLAQGLERLRLGLDGARDRAHSLADRRVELVRRYSRDRTTSLDRYSAARRQERQNRLESRIGSVPDIAEVSSPSGLTRIPAADLVRNFAASKRKSRPKIFAEIKDNTNVDVAMRVPRMQTI